MSKINLLILFLFLPFILFGNDTSINDALKELDACIAKKNSYESDKEQRIKSLENLFSNKNNNLNTQYQLCSKLYDEYCSYKYDSAYSIAGRMLRFAGEINDKNLIAESKMALAFSCMSAGLYKEASEISNSIDTTNLQPDTKADIYSFLSTLYMDMANFTAEPYYSSYRIKSLNYCNLSIEASGKFSPEIMLTKIRKYQLKNDYDSAIDLTEKFIKNKELNLHDFAIVSSTLAFFYEVKGDTAKAIIYFSKAAIADIKIATKETAAIRQLAELLYGRGDVQRAYSYALIALDDANFYNARQRKIEVGRILPIIEAGRFEIIKEQKDKLLYYLGLISILSVLFMISTFIILRQKKRLNLAGEKILQQNKDLLESNEKLTESQQEISKQNIDLQNFNNKLKEAHHIKDEYIGYFFSNNSVYLEKLEDYRKSVARKIRNRQFEDLYNEVTSADSRKEREDMFAMFDQIFMKIFPDFVNYYNKLFNEEDHITFKSGGTLTPEIRIFALIRLGITESERIAKFLDFSVSTVKNYKTKAKNRSIVPNDIFEQKIMEIESVKLDNNETIE